LTLLRLPKSSVIVPLKTTLARTEDREANPLPVDGGDDAGFRSPTAVDLM
jgi:hypothetical protein